MACVNPDGSLTASATAILQAMKSPSTPNQIAETTGLALFRVRSGLREMIEAKMATQLEGLYHITDLGSEKVR
jgi:hypothetical protein